MTIIKAPELEADFLNDFILIHPGFKIKPEEEMKERFFASVLDEFWSSDKDRLDYFVVYNTGEYFCQRRKLKYDFTENVSYWSTYSFTGATREQAAQLKETISTFFSVLEEVKYVRIQEEIQKIDSELFFFEQRYTKKVQERNEMLATSDWRVLSDIVDSYPGEKDMWIQWRSVLRDQTIKGPSQFDSNLEFFKYTYEIKWPVDPKVYRNLYPDGLTEDGSPAPSYLDVNDDNQWVYHDSVASTDFLNTRVRNLMNMSGQYQASHKKVKQATLNMMKLMKIDEVAPVDWSIYYTDDNQLEQM